MIDEARVEQTEQGKAAKSDGWYVVNATECRWYGNQKFGEYCALEGETRFPQVGVNLHVVRPGQPACHYHSETEQEDFLVLAGECLLLVEEQERRLRPGDFVHCPPGTRHVFVGAGDGPCTILMIGARRPGSGVTYPVSELASRHRASVAQQTDSPAESYAGCPRWEPCAPRRAFP
jgi:uncharacterized cupin superfamily protein